MRKETVFALTSDFDCKLHYYSLSELKNKKGLEIRDLLREGLLSVTNNDEAITSALAGGEMALVTRDYLNSILQRPGSDKTKRLLVLAKDEFAKGHWKRFARISKKDRKNKKPSRRFPSGGCSPQFSL